MANQEERLDQIALSATIRNMISDELPEYLGSLENTMDLANGNKTLNEGIYYWPEEQYKAFNLIIVGPGDPDIFLQAMANKFDGNGHLLNGNRPYIPETMQIQTFVNGQGYGMTTVGTFRDYPVSPITNIGVRPEPHALFTLRKLNNQEYVLKLADHFHLNESDLGKIIKENGLEYIRLVPVEPPAEY